MNTISLDLNGNQVAEHDIDAREWNYILLSDIEIASLRVTLLDYIARKELLPNEHAMLLFVRIAKAFSVSDSLLYPAVTNSIEYH
jgi:hypothetical protein